MAEQGASETRRSFFTAATLALGGVVGAVLAVPLVRYLFFPVGRKVVTTGPPVQVAIVAAQQRDAWVARDKVAVGSVWLRKDESGHVVAFSAVCPHLGCAIGYDGASGQYRCPCHKSAFDRKGEKQAGPAKRGMDPLPVKVEGGRVKVTFLRYRPDVSERIPA